MPAMQAGQPRPRFLAVEFVLLYVALPTVLAVMRQRDGGFFILPVLWVAFLPASLWLAWDGLSRRDFFGWRGLRAAWRGVALRSGIVALALLALVAARFPQHLFELPRVRPGLWVAVMLAYPILSVYPQGVIYRALYYRRYARLWPGGALGARLAGAVAFSLAHLFFLNPWALGLTLVGGWFFGRTYERTGSLAISNLEHALAGCAVFTVGMGRFFFHGTQAMFGHAPFVPGGG
jgi:hypothetical protein